VGLVGDEELERLAVVALPWVLRISVGKFAGSVAQRGLGGALPGL